MRECEINSYILNQNYGEWEVKKKWEVILMGNKKSIFFYTNIHQNSLVDGVINDTWRKQSSQKSHKTLIIGHLTF